MTFISAIKGKGVGMAMPHSIASRSASPGKYSLSLSEPYSVYQIDNWLCCLNMSLLLEMKRGFARDIPITLRINQKFTDSISVCSLIPKHLSENQLAPIDDLSFQPPSVLLPSSVSYSYVGFCE